MHSALVDRQKFAEEKDYLPFKERVAHINLVVGGASVPYGFDNPSRYDCPHATYT